MPSASQRLGSSVTLRAANRDERTIDIVASDFSVDSYNTRIDPGAWDLSQFIKNPVILGFHNDFRFPVAKALTDSIRVEGGELRMRIQFPQKGKYAEADTAFELYADGYMRGVSVGFMPMDWEDVQEGEDRNSIRVYRKVKLLEVSLVPIPSNDNALAQRAADLNHDLEAVQRRMMEFEEIMESRKQEINPEEHEKFRSYFEKKQPVNKAASRAMEKFFKARGLEQPADELEAFTRMTEIIEEEVKVTPAKEEVEKVEPVETTTVTEEVEEPTEPISPEPLEAPEDARKASVQIPLSELLAYPQRLAKAYTEAGVEALLRGVPPKDVETFIDGLNRNVESSLSLIQHGK